MCIKNKLTALLLCVGLCFAVACSDDDGPGPVADAGPGGDGKVVTDGSKVDPDGSGGGTCKSNADCTTTSKPFCDADGTCVGCFKQVHCANSTKPKCDATKKECVACKAHADCTTNLFGMACDTATGKCGCKSDGHCKNRGWGNKCDTSLGRCACKSDTECSSNANGPTCNKTYSKCSCKANAECKKAPYSKCFKPYSGATYNHCQPACKTNADCPPGLGICDTSLGKCVQCRNSADCTDPTFNICLASACIECGTDADCKKGYKWGNKCTKVSSTSTTKNCRCKVNADCAGNPNGPTCYTTYSKCSCKTDGDCKGAYSKCWLPYAGASYKNCQKPCATDKDCTSTTAPYCNAGTGKCQACTTSAHCAKNATNTVCQAATGTCVECTDDASCKAGYKWGNKCIKASSTSTTKNCRCKVAADCAGNPNGPACYTKYSKCSCTKDADCKKAPYTKCWVPYSGATYKNCQKPCKSNTDCTGTAKTCDTATGKCVACKVDKDCTSTTYKYCSPTLGECVKCKTNAHCAADKESPFCDPKTGSCGECLTDANCKTGYKWGNKCYDDSLYGKICGCKANTECAGNPNGPTCDTSRKLCTCKANTDCKKAPYLNCTNPVSSTAFKHCQKKCAKDADCTSTTYKYCITSTGKCAACKTDANCTSTTYKYCNPTAGKCVACKTDANCTSATNKYCSTTGSCIACKSKEHCAKNLWEKTCSASSGCVECAVNKDCTTSSLGNQCSSNLCICKSDADCKTNLIGKKCNTSLQACSCTVDTDCPTGKKCTGSTSFGTKYCK